MSDPEDNRPPGAEWTTAAVPSAAHQHHADLWSALARHEATLVNAVSAGADHEAAQVRLVSFLRGELLAHLEAEELVLYDVARRAGRHDLVAVLELDHRTLLSLTEHIARARTGLDAALSARALVTMFVLRMEKEETVLVPALSEAGIDVPALLAGSSDLLGTDGA